MENEADTLFGPQTEPQMNHDFVSGGSIHARITEDKTSGKQWMTVWAYNTNGRRRSFVMKVPYEPKEGK